KILRSVDLPAPLGPIRPIRSPARRSREMSVKRGRGPYALLRDCELKRTVIVAMPLLTRAVGMRHCTSNSAEMLWRDRDKGTRGQGEGGTRGRAIPLVPLSFQRRRPCPRE